jgi:hypothetical protein
MKIELHYFFGDDLHQMDATVRHQCEGEVLKIIEELSNVLNVKYRPQTEPYLEGGLKEIWSFAKNPIVVAVLTGVLTGVLIDVLSDHLTTDRELVGLQKESLRLEIDQRKLEIIKLKNELENGESTETDILCENLSFVLNNDYRVIRARSNYYKNLNYYPRVTMVSGQQINIKNEPVSEPKFVKREQFHEFILSTDNLPQETDEEATIEVISPVLKKGKFKWRGLYKGEPIDFYMKDKIFKDSVFRQQVSFTNGIFLKSILIISKKMNEIGDIYVSSYSVVTVVSYNIGANTIATKQGKKFFRDKKFLLSQMDLFEK